ncbi:MAG: ABC transporter permease [Chloroflexi bacterium]|nr:ABC transporter permease [Chloroflexota bacterium]
MIRQEQGARLEGSVELAQPGRFITGPLQVLWAFVYKTLVIAELEARKLRHDPSELIMRGVQPVLWLVVFGEVLTKIRAIPTPGNIRYLDFMTPGILAQSVLFIAIFSGMSAIWERDLGIVHKFLASPTPRHALMLGKSVSSGVRALPQAIFVYVLAVALGVKMSYNPLHIIGVLIIVVLAATAFAAFSLCAAFMIKSRDRFMGFGQVLTQPLFFASNAIYPINIMPTWLKILSHGNPLTYEVDALRSLMLRNYSSSYPMAADFGVLLLAVAILVYVGGKLYPHIAT